jgi:hypothetical protein
MAIYFLNEEINGKKICIFVWVVVRTYFGGLLFTSKTFTFNVTVDVSLGVP